MSPSNEEYQIQLNNRLQENWEALEEELPGAMERCKKFLKENPEDRLKSSGKLKKLKGKLKGILQYDITNEARAWYKVDRKQRIVFIKYVGHHP